ncbi:MAG: HAD-IC family P-type ATPase, partial [Methylococcales bacterium]|nr:HAD-IC family P-type ATPase [Methylococcales bacterium]
GDLHVLTGEAQPVEKEEGDTVLAATMVNSGKIFVRVDHAAKETTAAKIAQILQNTADFKSSIEVKATQFSDSMAIPSVILGGCTWAALGPVSATAVISCNFSLNARMISPLSVLNFLEVASALGILVKDGRCLELLPDVDTIVFDKTGTLTSDELHIEKVHVLDALSVDTVVQYAATAEHKQSHPVAKAIIKYAKDLQVTSLSFENAHYDIGSGIKVQIDFNTVHVGSDRFMKNEAITNLDGDEIKKIQHHCQENGYMLVYVAFNKKLVGVIELHVTIRPEAKKIIAFFKSKGITTYIISGDHESPTARLAQELGVDKYHSKILPQDKARIIQELQAQGKSVCFVGDGINDTVALKTSNVSVSIQGASTAAIDTAGIVLMDGTLNHLPALFDIAEEMHKNIDTGFKTVLIPGVVGIAGVLLFDFKIYATLVLYMLSLGAGTFNAMLPVLQNRKDEK